MLVSIDWQVLERSLPPGGLLKFRADAAARIWPDAQAARFATEYGVPHSGGLFRALPDLVERDPASPDSVFQDDLSAEPIDTPAGLLQPVGMVYQSEVFVRPADGTVWICDPDHSLDDGPDGGSDEDTVEFDGLVYELAHRDLSSFAYLVYKVEAERPRPEDDPYPDDWAAVIDLIRTRMTAWDRQPFRSGAHFWEMYLDSYPML
ncbi:SUKH-4 family immunity protein [Kitasatospora sp. NBC_00315]|uniref:SUKH-4 family immunity protein n=1 Tax=Kitasatospora sp. NBC_00315 TaxID=2975963 RepID=UPI003247AD90